MTIKLNMAESIEGMKFSTRLKSALLNIAGYPDTRDYNLDTVISLYHRDPLNFQAYFLRVPNAGRVTLKEFIAYADKTEPGDYTGRVGVLEYAESAYMQEALSQACNTISHKNPFYARLRKLQYMLDCSTIHIEQPDDQRPTFNRS
jgi:hypothetical protein